MQFMPSIKDFKEEMRRAQFFEVQSQAQGMAFLQF